MTQFSGCSSNVWVATVIVLLSVCCNCSDATDGDSSSVKITFNATWTEVCAKQNLITSSMYALFTSKTGRTIEQYRFISPNLETDCLKMSSSNETAVILFRISQSAPNNGTADEDETEALSKMLSKGDSIASESVTSVEYVEAPSSRNIFSTNIIVAMIVVVCVLYLIGFGLIVLTQSEGDTAKGPEVSYVISANNQAYKKPITPATKRR